MVGFVFKINYEMLDIFVFIKVVNEKNIVFLKMF